MRPVSPSETEAIPVGVFTPMLRFKSWLVHLCPPGQTGSSNLPPSRWDPLPKYRVKQKQRWDKDLGCQLPVSKTRQAQPPSRRKDVLHSIMAGGSACVGQRGAWSLPTAIVVESHKALSDSDGTTGRPSCERKHFYSKHREGKLGNDMSLSVGIRAPPSGGIWGVCSPSVQRLAHSGGST